jgi:hypothetical protein
VRDILKFYGNTNHVYYLYTDNQAAEHIATQPNMNEHSRSIEIRHHAIRQDYVDGLMRIGGVDTLENTADLLTKNIQAPQHQKHARQLNIQEDLPLTNTTTSVSINTTHAMKHKKKIHTTRQTTRRPHTPKKIPLTPPHRHSQHQLHNENTENTYARHVVHLNSQAHPQQSKHHHVNTCHHAHSERFLAHTT